MRKYICTKLLFALCINLLTTPYMYSGKKHKSIHPHNYQKNNHYKFYAPENRLKRKNYKQTKRKKARFEEQNVRQIQKITNKFSAQSKDLDKIGLKVINSCAKYAKQTLGKASLSASMPNTTNNKEMVKLVLFAGYLIKKIATIDICSTKYEDIYKKVEECCYSTLLEYRCYDKTTYKNSATAVACQDWKLLTQDDTFTCDNNAILAFKDNAEFLQNVDLNLDRYCKMGQEESSLYNTIAGSAITIAAITTTVATILVLTNILLTCYLCKQKRKINKAHHKNKIAEKAPVVYAHTNTNTSIAPNVHATQQPTTDESTEQETSTITESSGETTEFEEDFDFDFGIDSDSD